jgi:multidrug efflux system membrane fusion protein
MSEGQITTHASPAIVADEHADPLPPPVTRVWRFGRAAVLMRLVRSVGVICGPKNWACRNRLPLAICIGCLLVIAVSAALVFDAAEWAKSATALSPAADIPIQTTIIKPQSVELTRTGLGTVFAWNTAAITPQVSGKITELPFQEGAFVQTDAVLVRIDPKPFQAVLDQAKAKKAQDNANLIAAQKNLTRDETLLAKGSFATQQTVDNERAQVDAFKATIAGDEAAIESAQLNLDFATIKAPFAGVVGLRNVDLGNVVTTTTSIVTITQLEPIAVDFTLPESELDLVQTAAADGKPQVVALDQSGTNVLARGVLEVINNQVDTTTGTIKLKARFDNKDHKLWPGAFVQVRVVVKTEPSGIAVPSQAVQRGPDGPYVWLVSPEQTVRVQTVKLGDIQDERTVIVAGLSARDRVVVAGQYRLTPGAHVTESSQQPAHEKGSVS